MRNRPHLPLLLAASFAFLGLSAVELQAADEAQLPLNQIKLPPGFKIDVFARVPQARSLALGEKGTIFVGTRGDKVYAVRDADGDGKGEKVYTLASGLDEPNGVAVKDKALYVAEVSRILRFDDVEKQLDDPKKPVVLPVQFPSDKHHGWKFIAFGPDGKLYVPVGAPCNVCDKGDQYAAMFRIDADGKNKELVAKGIRNTVGFDWQPETKELFFTDNGRDMLGEDVPADELNRMPKTGLDFGFPRCHQGNIADPDFGRGLDVCAGTEKPVALLGAHVAALGMRFYKGTQFPPSYRKRIFIAEHGSWNRTIPVGYQVVSVALDAQGSGKVEPFATGWLAATGKAWGRPVDVLEMPDGALLVSDDGAGAIYRISYHQR